MKNILKSILIFVLLALSFFLSYSYHFLFRTDIVVSHFFYIPVILSGIWWGRPAIGAAVFLSGCLLSTHFFAIGGFNQIFPDIIRASMLIVVAFILAFLRERIRMAEKRTLEFSRKILSLREEEKKRTAIDLHDELGAMVVSVDSELDILADELNGGNYSEASGALARARGTFKKFIKNLKRLAVDLRPPEMDILGLGEMLRQHCQTVNLDKKIKIVLNIQLEEKNLREDAAIALYRITQEALSNIIKHSHSTTAEINLFNEGLAVKLDIVDNGSGFNVEESWQGQGTHEIKIGIEGMRQRTESLGGVFTIKSGEGHGCRIHVMIPQAYTASAEFGIQEQE